MTAQSHTTAWPPGGRRPACIRPLPVTPPPPPPLGRCDAASSPFSAGTAPEIPLWRAAPSSTCDPSGQSEPSHLALAPDGNATSSSRSEERTRAPIEFVFSEDTQTTMPVSGTQGSEPNWDSLAGCIKSLECRTGAEVDVLSIPGQQSVFGLRQQLVGCREQGHQL